MGVHPKIVSEMLGHGQIGITLDLDSHVTATMQHQAASALNGLFGCQLGCQRGRPERKAAARARSSVGQSSGLIIRRSQVRGLPGPPVGIR